MRTIVPVDVLQRFPPESVQVMELAFSSSWRELLVTGILATVNAEAVREALHCGSSAQTGAGSTISTACARTR